MNTIDANNHGNTAHLVSGWTDSPTQDFPAQAASHNPHRPPAVRSPQGTYDARPTSERRRATRGTSVEVRT
jgi:hypothetical protein